MTQTMTAPTQVQASAQPRYTITDEDKARLKRIAEAWKAYKGELTPPLKPMPGDPDDNVLTNRCKPVVRSGLGFLFGKELEIAVEEGAPQKAQQFINDTWGRQEARIPLLQKLGLNGAMAGTFFLRIVPGRKNKVRLVVVDPAIVVGIETAPLDCDTVIRYCLQFSRPERTYAGKPILMYYREEVTRIDPAGDDVMWLFEDTSADGEDSEVTWEIQHWTQVGSTGMEPKPDAWTPAGPPITWPYPFPPMFHAQNMVLPNDAWGEPDITPDLIGMNNALNLVASNINRILKLYGHPIVWGKGLAETSIDRSPGHIVILPPTPDAKLDAVVIHSDLANALLAAKDLRSDIDELTRIPGVATGRIEVMPRGITGIALELLYQSTLMKTEEKRCTYGEMIIDVSKALLMLARMKGDIDVSLAWQNPLPHDDLEDAQKAVELQKIGISNTTLQREAGYDPEEEALLAHSEDELKLAQQLKAQQAMAAVAPTAQPGQPPQPQGG